MPHEQISLRTRDGDCPVHVLTPGEGDGPWPAAIMYMDAGGVRPAVLDMAQRFADAGFLVLLPDLFYRYGPYGPFVPAEVFKGDVRAILGALMATTGPDKAAEDTQALLDHLDTRKDVAGDRVGVVGFCMGGGMALAAAAAFPDHITVVASFHGGNLATDGPTSPHLGAPLLKAQVYIAAAENDRSYPPVMAEHLEAALTDAGVRFRSETYPAAHGWMMPDFPVYDQAAADRGWTELLAIMRSCLLAGGVQGGGSAPGAAFGFLPGTGPSAETRARPILTGGRGRDGTQSRTSRLVQSGGDSRGMVAPRPQTGYARP